MVAAVKRTSNMMAASSQPEAGEDESDISVLIARLTAEVDQVACEKARSIQQITNQMKMLALNALIESSRAGAPGAGWWRRKSGASARRWRRSRVSWKASSPGGPRT